VIDLKDIYIIAGYTGSRQCFLTNHCRFIYLAGSDRKTIFSAGLR